jgi:type I restriction enzyme M protein
MSPTRAQKAVRGKVEHARFEEKLWTAADKLRGSMDAAEYKHVVLGLIFLKYISDSFDSRRRAITRELEDPTSTAFSTDAAVRQQTLEDRDEYEREGVFWVPASARWADLKANASKEEAIGSMIDAAMDLIEKENPSLAGTLPKDYGRESLDKRRLGELVNLISSIELYAHADDDLLSLSGESVTQLADGEDLLGQVYEYFLGKFANAEGKGGGEFYTPGSVVRLLVEMIEPYRGRVYDPCCGSGGMFVQASTFVKAHAGDRNDIAIYGQELNYATWRLARMNLAIRHISADLGKYARDTFHADLHPDLKVDFALANPPFNYSDWGGETLRSDHRWQYGAPPVANANFAWLQHIVSKLKPTGVAGVVLSNGSTASRSSGEGDIRREMVERDIVECIVALPPQLFTNTGIPACLWFFNRDKTPGGARAWRDRRGEVLFIDARKLGTLVTPVRRELSDVEIKCVADTYHAWRGERDLPAYEDVAGFCRSADIREIGGRGYVLSPSRYVGLQIVENDDEPLSEKIDRLNKELQQAYAIADQVQARVVLHSRSGSGNSRGDSEADPTGCRVTLGDLARKGKLAVNDGYRTSKAELGSHGVPILRVAEVLDGRIEPAFKDFIRIEYRGKFANKTSSAGDIVVTTKGTVGRVACIREDHPEFVYSPQVCYFRVLDPEFIDSCWLYHWFRSSAFQSQALSVRGQTDMADYINLADMRDMSIILPPIDRQRSLAEVLAALDQQVTINDQINKIAFELARAKFAEPPANG